MKIVISDYILGVFIQALFIGAVLIYIDTSKIDIAELIALFVFIMFEIGIASLVRLKSVSTLLGFITGIFACLVFVGMIVMELLIHPPSEE